MFKLGRCDVLFLSVTRSKSGFFKDKKMKKIGCSLIVLLLITAVCVPAQTVSDGEHYRGKLDMELSPDMIHITQRVLEEKPMKIMFKPSIDKKAVVSSGDVYYPLSDSRNAQMFLVEEADGDTFVAFDLNSDNLIEATERFPLKALNSRPNDLQAIVRLPIKNVFYKNFPLFVLFKRGFKHPKLRLTDRLILQSYIAIAYGTVNVKGRDVRLQYPFDLGSPTISTTDGLFGVDSNGDGFIRDEQFSPESSYATNSEIVFPLGNMYISTEKIDIPKNEITVRKRTKDEYLRLDLQVGKPIADFSFVDFEGKRRSLYEFKGKYLLIDFWGAWCHDCTFETPYHIEAIKRFHDRGFDILSLNSDEDIETAKSYLQKNDIKWTQARYDSILGLIQVTYRIQEYPSTILIGPDEKVLVLDQDRLRGDELLETLDQVLPKK